MQHKIILYTKTAQQKILKLIACEMVTITLCHLNQCPGDTDGAPAAKGSIALAAIVAQSAISEYKVAVLPAMDVVRPFAQDALKKYKNYSLITNKFSHRLLYKWTEH